MNLNESIRVITVVALVILTVVQCGEVCRSAAKYLLLVKRDPSLTLRVIDSWYCGFVLFGKRP